MNLSPWPLRDVQRQMTYCPCTHLSPISPRPAATPEALFFLFFQLLPSLLFSCAAKEGYLLRELEGIPQTQGQEMASDVTRHWNKSGAESLPLSLWGHGDPCLLLPTAHLPVSSSRGSGYTFLHTSPLSQCMLVSVPAHNPE